MKKQNEEKENQEEIEPKEAKTKGDPVVELE